MENFLTQEQWDEKEEMIQDEIWRLTNEAKNELIAEIKQLDMNMLDRFDKLIQRWEEFEVQIDKKHGARFDTLEKDVNVLKKNVALILKIVSKNGRKNDEKKT